MQKKLSTNSTPISIAQGDSSVLCDHLGGWEREHVRETQQGGVMGTHIYV